MTLAMLAFPDAYYSWDHICLLSNPACFSGIHPGHNKQHETNLSAEKINILFGIPQYIKQ